MAELPRGLTHDPSLVLKSVSLWVAGPLPGMNEIIAKHNAYRARGARGGMVNAYVAEKKQQTKRIAELAHSAGLPSMERVYFVFEWNERSRLRNPDNIAVGKKFIFDGLVSAKVLANDGWGEIAGWEDHFRVVNAGEQPGVWITMREVAALVQKRATRRGR